MSKLPLFAVLIFLLTTFLLYNRLASNEPELQTFSSSKLGFSTFQTRFNDPNQNLFYLNLIAGSLYDSGEGVGIDHGSEGEIETDENVRLKGFEEESKPMQIAADANDGYFWDHVTGVARRGFFHQSVDENRSNQWKTFFNFDFYANFDDRIELAFGSDDQPVNELIRNKLGEIRGIEDALLLKKSEGALSQSDVWVSWFENLQKKSYKGDSLRRNSLLRSDLELLNPMNNPLLQDPDGTGITVLTRSDKLAKQALDELKLVKFRSENIRNSATTPDLDRKEDINSGNLLGRLEQKQSLSSLPRRNRRVISVSQRDSRVNLANPEK